MWNNYLYLLIMVALLRIDYELNRPEETITFRNTLSVPRRPALDQRQREWADKAVKRYTEAQEKKWQRWNEAMFEESD